MSRQWVNGFFDSCTGCRVCELVCSSAKLGVYAPRSAMIEVDTVNEGLASVPSLCLQCEQPYCMKSCPSDAIRRDEAMGIVRVVAEKCTGCGMCVKACPIPGAIRIEPTSRKAVKCDVCDGDPTCVKYCATDALKLMKLG